MGFYRPPSERWGKVIVSVCSHFGGGGPRSKIFGQADPALDRGGAPSLRFLGRLIQPWTGGGEGGCPTSQIFG